jgi:hypothetical protein
MVDFLNGLIESFPIGVVFYLNCVDKDTLTALEDLDPRILKSIVIGSSYDEIIGQAANSHFGLCFLKNMPSKYASSPVKVSDYIVNGIIPICTPNFGDVPKLSRTLQYPLCFTERDSSVSYFRKLLAYVDAGDFKEIEALYQQYSSTRCLASYRKLFQDVLNVKVT